MIPDEMNIEKKKETKHERKRHQEWDEEFSLPLPRCLYTRGTLVRCWDIYLSRESEARRQKIRSSVKIA